MNFGCCKPKIGGMFTRKIKNRSGSISVQIIRKERGKYRVVRTVGTSNDPEEIDRLWQQAQHIAHHAVKARQAFRIKPGIVRVFYPASGHCRQRHQPF